MNYARVNTITTVGLKVMPVTVEIDVDKRAVIHDIDIVGLGDTVIKESKKRVKSSLKNSGFKLPGGRITVNLAPSDIKKEGSYIDLPIAVGLLKATGEIKKNLDDFVFFGELGLDGSLRKVRGVLPILLNLTSRQKNKIIILPEENLSEASIIKDATVYAVGNLSHLAGILNEQISPVPVNFSEPDLSPAIADDISDIKGHVFAKRALEIAAAGSHNISLIGSPGCGKTMLAKRLPGILPRLSMEEGIESTMIYSVAGLLDERGFISKRPFRAPHHTASTTSIIGGGSDAKPGEISLAHNGVLFMDEFPEFRKDVIEALRQPLEDGKITISRAKVSVTYPANFMLVTAQNPCPCGWYGDKTHECNCSWYEIARYNKKISGPMADRIDIFVNMPRLEFKDYTSELKGESSESIRKRVELAKTIQLERFKNRGIYSNSQMNHRQVEEEIILDSAGKKLLETAVDGLKLTGRSIDKILKVARTIADIENDTRLKPSYIAEAIQYRKKEVVS